MKYPTLFAVLLSLISCNSNKLQDDNCEVVDVDIYQIPAKQTDFIDGWRYAILETNNDQALIGGITDFDIDKEHILIVSDRQDIYLYDHFGKLVTAFNRRGQGPNEYTHADCAKLYDNKIWILSRSTKKLICYDESGHGIYSHDLPDWYDSFCFADNDKLILSADKGSYKPVNFIMFDLTTGIILGEGLPFRYSEDNYGVFEYRPFISNARHDARFVDMLDYHIYRFDSLGNLNYIRYYNFNTPFQPSDFKDKNFNEIDEACLKNGGIRFLGPAYYDGDISFQSFHLSVDHYAKDFVYRYDSARGSGDLIDCTITEEFPFLATAPLAFYDGWYITALNPQDVEFVENKFSKKYVDGIDEDSNPVLFFHHFK